METIVTIALSVLGTLVVVGLFVVPMMNRFAIKRLEIDTAKNYLDGIDETHRTITSEMSHVHERIDDMRRELDFERDSLQRDLDDRFNHTREMIEENMRYADSRFDKLERKLQEQINHLMDKVEVPTI